jgi:microcystin-dependent protein
MTSYRRINSRTLNNAVHQQDNMVTFMNPISQAQYPNYFSVPDASNTSLLVSNGSPYSASASPNLTFDGTTLNVTGDVNVTGNYYRNGYILVPAGTIIQSAAINVPNGWLDCNGQKVYTSAYPDLHTAIGYTFGGNDVSFNVPDMRGRVGIGAGTGAGLTARTLGATSGEETHILSAGEMPSHTHNLSRKGNTDSNACDPSNNHATESSACTTDRTSETNVTYPSTQFSTYGTGGGSAHNNMQPYVVLRYFIKY